MHDRRIPEWLRHAPAPGVRGFATLAAMEPARDLDVVLVPGLAFGRDGSRLGYGGGFYDTFLAETTALRVGVGLQSVLVATVPTLPHDARLDAVVTEGDVVRV